MFKKDISFNQQEKAQIFTLEAKAFFQSYIDALNFVK
jgi:hypothetical protein